LYDRRDDAVVPADDIAGCQSLTLIRENHRNKTLCRRFILRAPNLLETGGDV